MVVHQDIVKEAEKQLFSILFLTINRERVPS
jgi:hypothetical protein